MRFILTRNVAAYRHEWKVYRTGGRLLTARTVAEATKMLAQRFRITPVKPPYLLDPDMKLLLAYSYYEKAVKVSEIAKCARGVIGFLTDSPKGNYHVWHLYDNASTLIL